MGFWFFLSVVVVGRMAYKAYKIHVATNEKKYMQRISSLEIELKAMREKIQALDEAVFFDDFELKKQFSKLEKEVVQPR